MILAALVGFISGIFIASFVHFSIWFLVFVLLISVIFFVFGSKQEFFKIISVFTLLALVGIFRVNFSDLYQKSELDSFRNKKIEAEGIIVDEPDIRETDSKLTVKLQNITLDSKTVEVSEKILVDAPIYPTYSYGDKIKISAYLRPPQNFDSGGGRVFDYVGYLRARGIWYITNFARIDLISTGHGAYIKTILFKIKNAFTKAINNIIPEPESSLMTGLLLGGKRSLGKDLLTEFQKTGTSHIVVLSGYNIAIVAESIMDSLRFLPQTFSFGIGAISIILFTILSGGGASAWRAAIMVLVALGAKKLNRDYKVERALGFAIFLMLAPNPLLLAYDPSFELSILATIGIVFVSPIIAPYFRKIPEKFWKLPLREIISSTIATQIIVLPFLIYTTGIVSVVSLPVNVLVLGTIPITMFFGFWTGIVGLVSFYLSIIPAIFAYVLLWYQLSVIHIGSSLPFSAVTLRSFSPIVLIIIYIIIFATLIKIKNSVLAR